MTSQRSGNLNATSKGERPNCVLLRRIGNKANTQFIFKRVLQIDISGVKVEKILKGNLDSIPSPHLQCKFKL